MKEEDFKSEALAQTASQAELSLHLARIHINDLLQDVMECIRGFPIDPESAGKLYGIVSSKASHLVFRGILWNSRVFVIESGIRLSVVPQNSDTGLEYILKFGTDGQHTITSEDIPQAVPF